MRGPAQRTSASNVIASFWERVRSSPGLKGGFLCATVAFVIAAASALPNPAESIIAGAERIAFDAQMRLLRDHFPRAVGDDIVLVGIDPDTEAAFTEPLALWHPHFAALSITLSQAGPRAVGVDFVLPERTFDNITPGLDLTMMRGLVSLKRATRLVYVQTVNARGELVPVQANYRNIMDAANLGIDQQWRDPDGVSRVFSERVLSQTGEPVPTFAGQLLRQLGKPVDEGLIDYSIGAPIEYIPMHRVAHMDEAELVRRFRDRVVLVGHVARTQDRWLLPVKLWTHEAGTDAEGELSQPGVFVHLQVLRSHLHGGLLHPLPAWLKWLFGAVAVLAVFLRMRHWALVALGIAAPLALLGASLVSIATSKLVLPLATLTACFWLALIARGVFDAIEAVVERLRLQQTFAGQVSPAVLKEMLGGGLTPGVSGQLAEICVLFSDVRDFTTLSEKMPPEVITTVLQRYFDRMVHAVHRFDGTVDKFIGDGMMVLFGAPRKSADPCGDAVQCALAMMAELDALNAEFAREGLPTLVIGIGINYGTVTVGNIGSSERHNYSAIGDAVNVAARVEGLTKELGRKIVITDSVVSRIGERFQFDPLGRHNVKGHSPVAVWGIRTARAAAAKAEAEAVQ